MQQIHGSEILLRRQRSGSVRRCFGHGVRFAGSPAAAPEESLSVGVVQHCCSDTEPAA